ncbi:hypothetical protein J2S30_002297 [Herbaspirillum rubrisubalbicans]|uniref:ApeA N-terminal domain 1-containing protein n=1 Tax=Herbaspirillum rubrisubalbicans TaxID=80842 RepID=UPI00209F9C1C|nr:hypothetical protein [Herbaspirillum rubrisubalbicans]MCP1573918.1 hypothetical protein [Herbaspirillum rubrisubalbicans]
MEIDLSQTYKFQVRVHHQTFGDFGLATLNFGKNILPNLSFRDLISHERLMLAKEMDRLKAVTEEGEHFTLLRCSVASLSIYAEYVVAGDVAKLQEISIRFQDIGEWFAPFTKLNDKLQRGASAANTFKNIDVVVETRMQRFSVRSESVLEEWSEGENHIVHEHFEFLFRRLDADFSYVDIREKVSDLSTLFSILLGIAMHLVQVKVREKDGRWCDVYFPYFSRPQEGGKRINWFEYFANKVLLEDRWQLIFDNFYRSALTRICWVRLSGMKHYEGFWEFRLLGYVTLLDKYVSLCFNGSSHPLTKKQAVKQDLLLKSLQRIVPSLSQEQIDQVMCAANNTFPKGKKLDFGEKFKHIIDRSDSEVVSIVNFTDANFEAVKSLRDAIAHGDVPEIPNDDYSAVEIVVNKIVLLLTFFAFKDFGLTSTDFIKCLRSHSQLHRNAAIDHFQLNKATCPECVFHVSQETYDELLISSKRLVNLCFIKRADGLISYSPHYTERIRAHHHGSKPGVTAYEDILGLQKDSFRYFHTAYAQCGGEPLEIVAAFLIETDQFLVGTVFPP